VIILKGEGFSMVWREGDDIKGYNWRAGSLLVPPERWFHRTSTSVASPRVTSRSSRSAADKFPWAAKTVGYSESVKLRRDQIEYDDEDPYIRQMFEAELAKRAVASQMGQCLQGASWTVNIVMRKLCCFANRVHRYLRADSPLDAGRQSAHLSNQPQYVLFSRRSRFKKGFLKTRGLDVRVIRRTCRTLSRARNRDVAIPCSSASVVRGALRGMPMRALASLLMFNSCLGCQKPGIQIGQAT